MSGILFTVRSGAGQQFTGAPLAQGATVWNVDLVNGVWISSDRNVSPGNGLLLPAQASCDWTGSQLFACLDTGNTVSVALQVSDDVQNVSNPVGIAEAIALIGIPSVFVSALILPPTLVSTVTGGQTLSIKNFGSVGIYATRTGAAPLPFAGLCTQVDLGVGFGNYKNQMFSSTDDVSTAPAVGFIMPVLADTLEVTAPGALGNQFTLTVIGSNRVIPALQSSQDDEIFTQSGIATTSGVPIDMGSMNCGGGLASYFINTSFACRLQYLYYDRSGVLQTFIFANITPAAVAAGPSTFVVPLGLIRFQIVPSATAAAQTFFVGISGVQS